MSAQNYDAAAVQKIEIGDGVYAEIGYYTDEHFDDVRRQFAASVNDHLKNSGETKDASETEIKKPLESDLLVADALILNLEGYENLPADWKELMDAEDKIQLIRRAHNFVIDEESKKFLLGGNQNIPTACYFNDQVARQNHELRRKTIDDSSRYALIQSKQYKSEPSKRLGANAVTEYILQDDAKAALYDEIRVSVTGFENDIVPKRVKIMVVDYVYASSVGGKK